MLQHFLILLALASMPAAVLAQDRPYHMPGAVQRDVTAPSGETYRILIAVPDAPPPPSGYPILYVLDGEDNFPIAATTARRLVRAGPRSGVGPGIVVGIETGGLHRRARDYVPATQTLAIPANMPGHGLPTGGADRFLDFIEHVLQPALARDHAIDPARTAIAGHSFGGALVVHALLTRPGLFAVHAAASPSLWIGDGVFHKQASATAGKLPGTLILNVAEAEGRADIPSLAMAETLTAALAARGVEVHSRTLIGETHGTSMAPTLPQAVAAAFQHRP